MSQVTVAHPSFRNLRPNRKLSKKSNNLKKHKKRKMSKRKMSKRKITNYHLLPIKHRLIN